FKRFVSISSVLSFLRNCLFAFSNSFKLNCLKPSINSKPLLIGSSQFFSTISRIWKLLRLSCKNVLKLSISSTLSCLKTILTVSFFFFFFYLFYFFLFYFLFFLF